MKVLIVDDNQLIRMGLRVSLEMKEAIGEIFEATNGREAIEIAAQEEVDITILDVSMPVMDGIDALEELVAHCPVIMLTNEDDSTTVARAMQKGASGYIVHGSLDPDAIINALSACIAGGTITAGLPLTAFTAQTKTEPAAMETAVQEALTEREREVMEVIALGLGNQEIAARLFLSEKTVKNHINRIFSKLNVETRAQAIALWLGDRPTVP